MDRIRSAAARWLIDHRDVATTTEADDPKLIAYVRAQTGLPEDVVFDRLFDHLPAIVSEVQSSKIGQRRASGRAAVELLARGHESAPLPGVTIDPVADTAWINDETLLRTLATDQKRRIFGSVGNPGVPPIDRFQPRFWDVRAGDLAGAIRDRKHGRNDEQRISVGHIDDDVLLALNKEDPISATQIAGGLSLTGGHHRTWEIIERVAAGKIAADAVVRILVHD